MRMLLPTTDTPMGVWQGGIATEDSTSLPLKSDRRWSLLRAPSEPFGLHVHVYFVRLYSAEVDFTFILRRILPPLMGPTRPTNGPKAPRNGWRGVSVWCGASGRWAESWLLVHVCGLMWFGIGTCFGAMAPFAFPLLLPWLRVLWRRVMQQ